jgi:hypothetical protein
VISEVSVVTVAATLVPAVGYLPPFVFAATTLSSIGAGRLSSLHAGSPKAQWIGYQVVLGAGYGIGTQQSLVNVQASVEAADIGYRTSAVLLGNILGGSIFISIAQAIFLGEVLNSWAKFPERLVGDRPGRLVMHVLRGIKFQPRSNFEGRRRSTSEQHMRHNHLVL